MQLSPDGDTEGVMQLSPDGDTEGTCSYSRQTGNLLEKQARKSTLCTAMLLLCYS